LITLCDANAGWFDFMGCAQMAQFEICRAENKDRSKLQCADKLWSWHEWAPVGGVRKSVD
jgi:hypothetical protein